MNDTPAFLQVRGLCKAYGDKRILHDIDFAVAEGETVVLIGPSGSGKTTLLRCLNWLERPDTGVVQLAGEMVGVRTDGAPKGESALQRDRRRFGFVFQRFNLFNHLTARRNVSIGPELSLGLPRAEADARADECLARVRMAEHAHKRPSALSGGQQQRVAIARALAMRPSVILFDEPTSALDPELVAEVLDVMRELSAARLTMVVVTHEMRFARQAADRVVFMDAGRVVEEGQPDALFTAPESPRLRDFLAHLTH